MNKSKEIFLMKDKIKELVITLIGTGGIYYIAFSYISGFYNYFGIPSMFVELELSYFIISLTSVLTIIGLLYLMYSFIKYIVPARWDKKKTENIMEFVVYIGVVLVFGYLTEFTKSYIIVNSVGMILLYSYKIYRQKQLKRIYENVEDIETENNNSILSKSNKTSNSKSYNKKSRFDVNDSIVIFLILILIIISSFSFNLGKKMAESQKTFTVIETADTSEEKVV